MSASQWTAPRRDLASLKREFSKKRMVIIPDFLEQAFAERIYEATRSLEDRFWYKYNVTEKQKSPSDEYSAAGHYLTYPVTTRIRNHGSRRRLKFALPADELGKGHPLVRLNKVMNSSEIQSLVSGVTSVSLTRHSCLFSVNRMRSGDYIGAHTDGSFPRRITFVLFLTKGWKQNWGGNFYCGKNPAAILPGFNSLLLFEVPAWHRVSRLAERAGERNTVAGWFHDYSKSNLLSYVTTTGEIPQIIQSMAREK